jgi:hypothetical protein
LRFTFFTPYHSNKMSDDLKKRDIQVLDQVLRLLDFRQVMFDNFPRIFISSSDSCVPSDCKSYGCSTILGHAFWVPH